LPKLSECKNWKQIVGFVEQWTREAERKRNVAIKNPGSVEALILDAEVKLIQRML